MLVGMGPFTGPCEMARQIYASLSVNWLKWIAL